MLNIERVQTLLKQEGMDGWLLYDFRRSNSLACQFLAIPPHQNLSRRLFYWIPQKGTPVAIVHQVEPHIAAHFPGQKRTYAAWKQLEEELKSILKGVKKVAMEYSPKCAIPVVSKVDAGMVEMIRSLGPEVVSSSSFLQYLTCQWGPKELEMHRQAAMVLDQTAARTWDWIAGQLKNGATFTEYDIQQFILREIHEAGCEMEGAPICGVNQNSSNPHYEPSKTDSKAVKKGDWILIDLWCKKRTPGAVYADISRVAVAASEATARQQAIFQIVRKAQKAATEFVEKRVRKGEPVRGWEVDAVAREVIAKAGYGDFFTHRTGHNIHHEDHGPGANIDNFETQDDRLLIPQTCFSIEPGIYLPNEFGVRLEYDIFIHGNCTIEVTGGIQDQIVTLV